MANTGVGGIKDSQGNYEIVGKSNSALGTRGGTLLVPVGDVVGQTSGTLAVNVYTASTLTDPDTLTLNVQEFTPGTPPSVPITPLALGRLSTMTCWPSSSPIFGATVRAVRSVGPPGG